MSRQDELLRYLNKSRSIHEYQSITALLLRFGFPHDGSGVYKFLSELSEKQYIDWRDERPIITNIDEAGGWSRDETGGPQFAARIKLAGVEYLSEKSNKQDSNRTAKLSLMVAGLAVLLSGLQWYLAYRKEEKNKEDYVKLSARIDSVIASGKNKEGHTLITSSIQKSNNKSINVKTKSSDLKKQKRR